MTSCRGRMAVDFLLQAGAGSEPCASFAGEPPSEASDVSLPPKYHMLPRPADVSRRPYRSSSNLAIMQLANAAERASLAQIHDHDHVPYSPVSSNSFTSSVEEQIVRHDRAAHPQARPRMSLESQMSSSQVQPLADLDRHPVQARFAPQEHPNPPAALSVPVAPVRTPQARKNVCPSCGETFNRKVQFLYHLLDAHKMTTYEGRPILPCSKCSYAFLRNTDRSKHDACVHEKLRPFRCDAPNCSSAFFFAKDLTKHRSTVHLKNKPFPCQICFKAFGKREHMTSHVKRVHEKLRPFKCDVCDIRLASKYNLQGHLKTNAHAAAETLARRDGRTG